MNDTASTTSAGSLRIGGTRDAGAFRRLLVAVDDSDQAGYAVAVADQIAADLRSNVLLLNVFEFTYLPNVDAQNVSAVEIALIAPEVRAACMEMSRSLLEKHKKKLPHAPHVETLTRQGDAATQILDVADAYGVDLIIMGTHARGALARAILGSTAQAVTRRAACPVVTVSHEPAPRPSDGCATVQRTTAASVS
jgi:nucleotide-binding universal stress UspA family protein